MSNEQQVSTKKKILEVISPGARFVYFDDGSMEGGFPSGFVIVNHLLPARYYDQAMAIAAQKAADCTHLPLGNIKGYDARN